MAKTGTSAGYPGGCTGAFAAWGDPEDVQSGQATMRWPSRALTCSP